MHISDDSDLLRRMVSWLRPGGWLFLEEPDFGMWLADADAVWASHPDAWHRAFPSGSLGRGRSLLRQIPKLGLIDIGADGEVDIIHAGTPLAEFYGLSMAAIGPAAVRAGALTDEQAAALVNRPTPPDFLACRFVYIGCGVAAAQLRRRDVALPRRLSSRVRITRLVVWVQDRCPASAKRSWAGNGDRRVPLRGS